eukprot:484349_1
MGLDQSFWMILYSICTTILAVSCISATVIYFDFFENVFMTNRNSTDINKVLIYWIFIIGHIPFMVVFLLSWFGVPLPRFNTSYQIKKCPITKFFFIANSKSEKMYTTLVYLCTLFLFILGIFYVFYIYLLHQTYDVYFDIMGVIISECINVVIIIYVILFRFYKGHGTFWFDIYTKQKLRAFDINVNDIKFSNRAYAQHHFDLFNTTAHEKIAIYEQTFSENGAGKLVWKVVYPLYMFYQWLFLLLGLLIIFGVVFAPIFIFSVIIFIISLFLCCGKWSILRSSLLNMKRFSSFEEYFINHISLSTWRMDHFFAIFVKYKPFKHLLNPAVVYLFQQRYIKRLNHSSIPSYNLHRDYITLDVLYRHKPTYNRLLPSADDKYMDSLPEINQVLKIFERKPGTFKPENTLGISLLFAMYVRFFTHQFTNTNGNDPFKTNFDAALNMSQLYGDGIDINMENKLRKKQGGLLKSQWINNEEFPPFEQGPHGKQQFMTAIPSVGETSIGYYAIYLIWFRQHQYIANSLHKEYPLFDDERLYQTTKLINILLLIKSTLYLYGDIGVVQTNVPSEFEITDLENLMQSLLCKLLAPNNKLFPQNSRNIFIEFNFLYRWHQLIPPQIELNDDSGIKLKLPYPNASEFLTKPNNLETLLTSFSATKCGKLDLQNTESFLTKTAVFGSIKKSRQYKLQSFNAYRKRLGFKPYDSIDEISDNTQIVNQLKQIYNNDVNKIEYYVGIFAEEKLGNALHGCMVTAVFSSFVLSLLTSTKLLRKDWKEMLTPLGKQIVNQTDSIKDLTYLHTNIKKKSRGNEYISFRTISKEQSKMDFSEIKQIELKQVMVLDHMDKPTLNTNDTFEFEM